MSSFSRKVTSAVSVLAITLSAVGTSLTAFAANSEFLPYADALATAGIVKKQDTEAGYRLGDKITRAEMAKIAANIAELEATECTGKVFSDVTTSLGDLCGYIEAAADAGFVSKTNTKFRPLDLVTRAETVKMLLGAKGIASSDVAAGYKDVDAKLGDLAGYINAAAAEGIVTGSDKNAYFRPNDTSSRGEAFKIAANAAGLSVGEDDLGDLDDLFGDDTTTDTGSTSTGTTSTDTTVVVATGDLEVGLAASSPASRTVPLGTTVVFGKLDFSAGSADAQFSSVTVTREGLGSRSDFDKVWLEKDGVRVTSRQSITTEDKAVLTFFPALIVKAGSTVTLDLVARYKLDASTNVTNNFAIVSASDVVAGGTVKGTFPIVTGGMTTSGYKTLPVVYDSAAKNDSGTTYTSTYKVGDKAVELAQFKITAAGSGTIRDRDVTFKAITLKNDGTSKIAKGLANLGLYKGSEKISTAVSTDGEYVTFTVGSGSLIKYGNTETFYVRADLVGLDSSTFDTYKFTTKYEEDVNIVEANTGFGSRVYSDVNQLNYLSSVTNGNYKVEGGKITLARSTDAPNTKTIAKGGRDISLLKADVFVKEGVRFEGVKLDLGSSAAYQDGYSVFKLKLGSTVVATFTPGSSNFRYLEFDTSFEITKDTTIEVLADVKSNATYLGQLKIAALDFTALSVYGLPEYIANGNKLASTDLVGSVEGANVTIGTPTLTVTRNDGIQAGKVLIAGSKAVKVAGYTIKASDVDDLVIQKMKFTVTGATSASLITNAKLMVGGTQAGDLTDFAGNQAEWNNLSVKVAKNQQIQLDLYVDFSTSFTASNMTFTFKGNDMSVRDSSSNTLTLTGLEKDSTNFVVTTGGAVKVAYNSNTPTSSVAPASLTEKEVARFTLGATDDKVKITNLYFINATPLADGAAFATGTRYLVKSGTTVSNFTKTYGDTGGNQVGTFSVAGTATGADTIFAVDQNLGSRVNAIALYKLDGTKIADGSINDEVVSFDIGDSSNLVIDANNNDYTVIVKVKFNSITTAAQSGKFVSLNAGVTPNGAVTSTINGMRVLSDSTGVALSTGVTGFAKSNPTLVTKSIATVAKTTDARLSTKPAVGAQKVYAVQVTADAAGSIDLAKLTARITPSSHVLFDSGVTAKLYDAADLRVVASAAIAQNGGDVAFTGFTETISAGTSKTYLVEVTVSGLSSITTGDSISASLATDSSFAGPALQSALSAANFIWSDRSDSAHTSGTADYYNGYKVNGLEGAGSNTISY